MKNHLFIYISDTIDYVSFVEKYNNEVGYKTSNVQCDDIVSSYWLYYNGINNFEWEFTLEHLFEEFTDLEYIEIKMNFPTFQDGEIITRKKAGY